MSEIIRFCFVLFIIGRGGIPLLAQTPLVTGEINKYARVTSVGTGFVIIDNIADFAVGDTVMIMQMSGVRINAGADLQGSYQNTVGTPGKYEILIISAIDGSTKRVSFSRNLLNAYDASGKVQIIKVRSYSNAVVNSLLTCQEWDSSAVRGGVLAFLVKGVLTLNADINVNGKGFIGGKVAQGLGACQLTNDSLQKFSYSIWSSASGYKGDGIGFRTAANTPLYPDYVRGKGVNLTGGGGGNGHYSGGGGGSSYGKGSEGDVEAPGCPSGPLPGGRGGYALTEYSTLNQGVFMGGGGGASVYLTTPTTSAGGRGGGIIIILADSINGNGRLISAEGIEPDANTVPASGAGGGGGGGSLAISTRFFTTSPVLSANGGKGGNNNAGQNGAGGGGGGGLVWTTGTFPGTATVAGGLSGTYTTGDPDKDGFPGLIRNNLVMPLNGFLFNAIYSSGTLNPVDSICEGMIPPRMTGTLPTSGSGTYTYQWQRSYDNNTWSNVSGTSIDYTPTSPETATVWFRRIADDGAGITDISKPVRIIVHPKITGNIVGSDTTLCYNQNPEELYPLNSGPGGGTGLYFYKWEQSPDNSSWSGAAGTNTNLKYDPQALTATTYYHRIVNSGACTDISTRILITILPSITGNNIQADQTICQGTIFSNLTGDTPSGGASPTYTYQWMSSPDNSSWTPAATPNSGIGYNPQNDSPGTTFYRRVVYSGLNNTCQSVSSSVQLLCHPSLANNTISAPQTICEGSAPATLDGTVPQNGAGPGTYNYQWSNSLNGTSFNLISGVTTEDFPGVALTANTWYRRIVNSSACTSTSNNIMITVDPAISGFQIVMEASGHDTICTGDTPAMLTGTPAGGLGTYSFIWASSTDNNTFTNLGPVTPTYQPGPLTATTWFRRTVSSGVCSENSTFKVTVLPLITGNTLSADQTVCNTIIPSLIAGNSPGGGDGKYRYLWEKKDALSPDWVNAAGTNNAVSYQPPLLGGTTRFRRNVFSGENNCCTSVSPVVTITVDMMPLNITAGPDRVLLPYQFAAILEGSFDGTGTSAWSYVSGDGDPVFEDPGVRNTIVRKLGFGDNVFEFRVTNNTCIADPDQVILSVPDLTIPQGVTPNNDGINDYFNVEGLEFTHNELVIINTGGAVVYRTNDYRSDDPVNAWTGLDLSGKEVPEGTYYFLLTINGAVDFSIPDYVAHISGFIILRR